MRLHTGVAVLRLPRHALHLDDTPPLLVLPREGITISDYDAHHRAERADWATLIAAGHKPICRRCNKPITPGQPFDLGHRQDLALGGRKEARSPEHEDCNRAAGQAITVHTPPSRHW